LKIKTCPKRKKSWLSLPNVPNVAIISIAAPLPNAGVTNMMCHLMSWRKYNRNLKAVFAQIV